MRRLQRRCLSWLLSSPSGRRKGKHLKGVPKCRQIASLCRMWRCTDPSTGRDGSPSLDLSTGECDTGRRDGEDRTP